jgi:hypothetical protein
MTDETTTNDDEFSRSTPQSGLKKILQGKLVQADNDYTCSAYGFVRANGETLNSLELRLPDDNSIWLPYRWLNVWQYNPSHGLLLRFSGDIIILVLVRGSNLDQPLNDGSLTLMRGGLQRQRILYLRQMKPEEIRQVGSKGPTIHRIEVAEFTSKEAATEWQRAHAPGFLREEK